MRGRWTFAIAATLWLGACAADSNGSDEPPRVASSAKPDAHIKPDVHIEPDGPSEQTPAPDADARRDSGAPSVDRAAVADARPAFMGTRTMEPLVPGDQPLRFGAGQDGKSQFAGEIDRIRLYRRVLTEAEIQAEAKHSYQPCNNVGDCVGDWNFDDGSFANAAGPALPARLVGAGTSIEAPEGKAVQLQGGFLEVANDPALAITDKMSWSLWLRSSVTCPDAIASNCAAARLMDKGTWLSVESRLDHRELSIYMRDPKAKYAFGAVEGGPVPGVWTHYALTFDTTGGIRCYRNGKLVKWHSPDGRTFAPLGAGAGPLRFGADSKGAWPFPGALDNIRLYARALTATEVASHQQRKYEPCAKGGSCLGEWTFEGANATAIANTAGPDLLAQLSGAATLIDGPDGKAVQLNGGFVTVDAAPALAASAAFSFSTWALRAPCPAGFPMMCDLQRMVDRSGWFAWEQRHGGTRILMGGKAYTCDPWPKENVWAHLAITFDVKDGLRCYIDGKEHKSWLAGTIDNN